MPSRARYVRSGEYRRRGLCPISLGFAQAHRIEEKVFLPAAQKLRGGEPLPVAPRLRLDHGALVALLVPSPTAPVVAAIRAIFKVHNPIEEEPGGMYDQCEQLRKPRGGLDIGVVLR